MRIALERGISATMTSLGTPISLRPLIRVVILSVATLLCTLGKHSVIGAQTAGVRTYPMSTTPLAQIVRPDDRILIVTRHVDTVGPPDNLTSLADRLESYFYRAASIVEGQVSSVDSRTTARGNWIETSMTVSIERVLIQRRGSEVPRSVAVVVDGGEVLIGDVRVRSEWAPVLTTGDHVLLGLASEQSGSSARLAAMPLVIRNGRLSSIFQSLSGEQRRSILADTPVAQVEESLRSGRR
jgi:hypothetical protein